MTVKVNKQTKEFLDSFEMTKEFNVENKMALYYLSRLGWGYPLTDGNGKDMPDDFSIEVNTNDELYKDIVKAIMTNDYELEEKKFVIAWNLEDKDGKIINMFYQGGVMIPTLNIDEATHFFSYDEAEKEAETYGFDSWSICPIDDFK